MGTNKGRKSAIDRFIFLVYKFRKYYVCKYDIERKKEWPDT